MKSVSTPGLKSSYWQVDQHPDDEEETAFSVGQGLYQFTIMPFGLCSASTMFERIMESVLRSLTYGSCLVYLDAVIVTSCAFQEHLLNLQKVFQRFQEAHLKLTPEKCQLLTMLLPIPDGYAKKCVVTATKSRCRQTSS
jgi:hypothetical protein